uniref:ADAM metallopeptidase domain 32 n=1 Tax=Calidris pygmaea TaxID=425635 RepID=A0A8C3JS67_9CHAR
GALTISEHFQKIFLFFYSRFFISDDFKIYTYNQNGSLRSDSPRLKVMGGCHYRGYVEGFPSSAVTLSTCSGLRGFLQFENVSYGIEPLGHSAFEYFVYRVSDKKPAGSLLATSLDEKYLSQSETKHRREMALYIVLERALMFRSFNLTIVLSAMEIWMDDSTFQKTGDGGDVLVRLLQWKQSSPVLQPHEVPYLLLYRDRAAFVGATALGKACQRDATGAVYQKSVTLESFSVLLAQLLARSLGINYDNPKKCRCPGSICIMTLEARVSGAKAFSKCSIREFKTFLKRNKNCPFIRHTLRHPSYRITICGNGVVEPGEQCDCGAAETCALDMCCTPRCKFKPGMQCSLGLCCENCQNSQCRPAADAQCDLAEFCNGSSASCPPDLYVQDGHGCERGTGYCYQGHCQSPDLQCQALYGRGNGRLRPHQRQNLECGKLVCAFPNHIPFTKAKGAIIYAQVQEHLCVSFDFMRGPTELDPLLVKEGTKCGPGKVRNIAPASGNGM